MSELTAAKSLVLRARYFGGAVLPVKDEEIIYPGAVIVAKDGEWRNATATSGLEGRYAEAPEAVDNTDDGKSIEGYFFDKNGKWLTPFRNDDTAPVTATDLGNECFFVDNQTVSASNGLLASLIARVTELKTDFLAHAAGTGTYHGTADLATYTITTPTTEALLYTSCGQLKTSGLAHVVKVSGSPAIHGAADTAAQGALSALVTPATLQEARLFIESFAAIMFGSSGHTTRTAPAVHGAADATNVLTSDPATASRSSAGIPWAFGPDGSFDVTTDIVWVEVK